jgi:hypothetical protein
VNISSLEFFGDCANGMIHLPLVCPMEALTVYQGEIRIMNENENKNENENENENENKNKNKNEK